jgi:diguanylate cyclase (GGDEF)-like protein/PAS domain S-box-containing protein
VLKTLKGRTALAAALLAGVGIAMVTSLQSKLSERSVIASTVLQHEAYTARVAGEIDDRLRQARASLSEFAASVPGEQLRDAATLHYYLSSRVGIQQAFESVAIYDTAGQLIASRPSIPAGSIAQQPWFGASLRRAVVGPPMHSQLSRETVIPLTYRVYDEAGALRGVAVGTLPFRHDQLFSRNARDADRGHFVVATREGQVVLHPDERMVGRPLEALGPAASIIRRGQQAGAVSVAGVDSHGVRSLYAFHAISATDWTLAAVVSNEAAYASLDRLSRQMLLAGGALALLMIPAMWVLVGRMLLPLDELRREMRRLRDGGDPATLRQHRGVTRELQQVAEEFAGLATARQQAEALLQQEKDRAEVTLQSIGDAVVATDRAGRITAMNRAAEALTGWSLAEAGGRPFAEVVALCDEASTAPLPDLPASAIDSGVIASVQPAVLRTRGGTLLPIDNSAAPIRSAGGEIDGAVVVLRNVALERAASRELTWRATHDAMTGLVNRVAYENALAELVERRRDGDEHSVIMIDLDRFKIVNDTCGHAAGDELLKQLARMFLGLTRQTDLVARLGGDEFAVLMHHCSRDHAMTLADKLRRAVAEWRFQWEGKTFRVGASLGVAVIDRSFADASAIQKAVDMACYMAKRTGRNRICLHSSDNQAVEAVRLQMQQLAQIQDAIDCGRLRLYAQPIRPLDSGVAHGLHFEVLLRMLDEGGRLVAPGDFLPAAERYGLMDQLDRWVIEHTLAQCARRFGPDRWHELDTASVNLSALSLRDARIADFILEALQRHGMPARCLCMEITETAVIENLSLVRQLLDGLREHGVRIALDDFGVGMTSLSELRALPVDVLKIDGSFVRGIDGDALNSEIVDAIQRIATRRQMKTVAECVERAAELRHLRGLGVDFVQGYLMARPAPLDTVIADAEARPAPADACAALSL